MNSFEYEKKDDEDHVIENDKNQSIFAFGESHEIVPVKLEGGSIIAIEAFVKHGPGVNDVKIKVMEHIGNRVTLVIEEYDMLTGNLLFDGTVWHTTGMSFTSTAPFNISGNRYIPSVPGISVIHAPAPKKPLRNVKVDLPILISRPTVQNLMRNIFGFKSK